MAKQDNLATDLMRSHNYVRRFMGVRFDDADGAWVLSHPEFPPDRSNVLAKLLLARSCEREELAAAVGAREVLRIDAGKLGKCSYHLGKLRNPQFRELIAEGVRPLRALRGQDLDALLATFDLAFDRAARPADDDPLRAVFGEEAETIRLQCEAAQACETTVQTARFRVEGLVEAAELLAANQGPPPRLTSVWATLDKLPEEPVARARGLVALFRELVGDLPHQFGRRRTLEAEVRGLPLTDATRRLAELVPPEPPAARTGVAERAKALELAIRVRHLDLALPGLSGEHLATFVELVRQIDDAQLVAMWPAMVGFSAVQLSQDRFMLQRAKVSGDHLLRAAALEVLSVMDEFDNGHRADAYLDAVEYLAESGATGFAPDDDWFVAAFAAGRSWEPSLVLSLLAQKGTPPEALVGIITAARESDGADFSFAQAIADWDAPHVLQRPAEWDAVGEMLQVTVSDLERYLHWRRLAGHGETFSTALLKPLQLTQNEERQLAHLRGLPVTPPLQRKIAALEDETARGERFEASAQRARNAFERALPVLRQESLDAVIERTIRSAFEKLLGRAIAGKLPPRLRSLMFLVSADNIDVAAVRELLEDVLAGRELNARKANQRWLKTISQRGVDTDAWLSGVDVVVDIRGQKLRFTTERDPLHVLEMGTYFDTCLSLGTGFNAASTLTNAIDVNKHVLYGRRDDGTVVARKLIAVTDDGRLLGYRTYAHEDQPMVDAQLADHLFAFAETCGLVPGDKGAPTKLHGTFWYDDGTSPWRRAVAPVPVPEGVPTDGHAIAEWAYVAGFDHPEMWRWGMTRDYSRWRCACEARLAALDPKVGGEIGVEAWQYLAARGEFEWMRHADDHPWSMITQVMSHLPADVEALRRLLGVFGQLKQPKVDWSSEMMQLQPVLALLTVEELTGFIRNYLATGRTAGQDCFDETHDHCIANFVTQATDVLQASWIRNDGGDVDALFTSRDPVLQTIGLELSTRLASPDIARRLRHRFKQTGPDDLVEWGLARQDDDASRWLLESAGLQRSEYRVSSIAESVEEPSQAEMLYLLDGLYRREPTEEALDFFVGSNRWNWRCATLPFYASEDAIARVLPRLETLNVYQAIALRELCAKIEDPAGRVSTLGAPGSWDAIEVLGANPQNWLRQIEALALAGRTVDAAKLATYLAAELPPAEYERLLSTVLATHGAAFAKDKTSVLAALSAEDAQYYRSYRLIDTLAGL